MNDELFRYFETARLPEGPFELGVSLIVNPRSFTNQLIKQAKQGSEPALQRLWALRKLIDAEKEPG